MVAAVRKIVSKRGRKRKARGVKAASPEQKMGAKEAKMKLTDFKKLSDAEQDRDWETISNLLSTFS